MTDSQSLLAEYVRTGSDAAFRELVGRYVNLVYSTALRLTAGDRHRAEDVAQVVFTALARQAGKLPADVQLGGWLHRHTCFEAGHMLRRERRRQSRERQAMEMNQLNPAPEADFTPVAPLLDAAINELDETDRTVILLRFYEQHDFPTVGQAIGRSEDAARMRVNRALDKLQGLLQQRGITTTATALAVALPLHAVQAAPTSLAAIISATAVAGTGTVAATLANSAIVMTATQKIALTLTIVSLTGAGIYEARQAATLRTQVQTLRRQLAGEIRQAEPNPTLASKPPGTRPDETSTSHAEHLELLRLRSEVGRLSAQLNSDEWQQAAALMANVQRLEHYFDATPNARTPELQFLDRQRWVETVAASAINEVGADQDKAYRSTASELRSKADFSAGAVFKNALDQYQAQNSGRFPTELDELKPFFKRPEYSAGADVAIQDVDAIFQRWQLVPAAQIKGVVAGGDMVITQKAPVDALYDDRVVAGEGVLRRGFAVMDTWAVLEPVRAAYEAAHDGKYTEQYEQLQPYASSPQQKTALQQLIASGKR